MKVLCCIQKVCYFIIKKMNEILQHFDDSEIPDKVICKKCKKLLNNTRIYNLKSHLTLIHKINLKNVEKSRVKSKITKTKIEVNKAEVIRSYIGLVTENGLPFEVLNSSNMRNLLKPISDALNDSDEKLFCLNADNARKILKSTVSKLRSLVKLELENKLFSIKIDSATRLDRNIFGISVQFCKEGEIISRVISMVELKGAGSTKAKNLAGEILKSLAKYDLKLQQVIAVTSDNGANMLKTTSLLSQCLSKYESDDFFDNDDYESVLNEIYNDNDINCGEIIICRCAAHTAQLVALDVIKHSKIKEFILQCRNFTKFLRKPSNGFRYLFEINKIKIPQIDCPTRWGSTFKMIMDLKAAKPFIEQQDIARNSTSEDFFGVNEMYWKTVDDFLVLFAPINDILIKYQEENLHYSNFYANWLTCKLLVQQIVTNSENDSFVKTVGELILQFIDNRSVLLLNNNLLIACLYFDPRFQHTLNIVQKERAISCLKSLWNKYASLNKEFETSALNSTDGCDVNLEDEDLLTAFLRQDVIEDTEINVHAKIENLKLPFLKSDTCVLKYWKERKSADLELYIISNIIYGVPPTQVIINNFFYFSYLEYIHISIFTF